MQILQVIKRHGYRLEDVANALGITKGSLSATINGSPNVKKLIEIALVIGCSPAEFFDDWYENEGKEQAKPVADEPNQPADSAPETEQQQEQSQSVVLTPAAAILCPHCGKAITLGVVK